MKYPDNYSITDANFDCNQDATSQTLHMGVSPDIIKTQTNINKHYHTFQTRLTTIITFNR